MTVARNEGPLLTTLHQVSHNKFKTFKRTYIQDTLKIHIFEYRFNTFDKLQSIISSLFLYYQ